LIIFLYILSLYTHDNMNTRSSDIRSYKNMVKEHGPKKGVPVKCPHCNEWAFGEYAVIANPNNILANFKIVLLCEHCGNIIRYKER